MYVLILFKCINLITIGHSLCVKSELLLEWLLVSCTSCEVQGIFISFFQTTLWKMWQVNSNNFQPHELALCIEIKCHRLPSCLCPGASLRSILSLPVVWLIAAQNSYSILCSAETNKQNVLILHAVMICRLKLCISVWYSEYNRPLVFILQGGTGKLSFW
jgi:hypothetical protein